MKNKITTTAAFDLSQIFNNADNQAIATPTEFINSTDCKDLLRELTGQSTPQHFTLHLNKSSNHYCTHSKWLFLAYVRHCFGSNLNDAITVALEV
ncbi:MAG: hypothetical protein E6Q32_06600 [Neisseriales bacterium]|jgi:hypothetical protein|nr:MAG: hypothetical protein E6Q32_06600 [Neisseriales bacterium]